MKLKSLFGLMITILVSCFSVADTSEFDQVNSKEPSNTLTKLEQQWLISHPIVQIGSVLNWAPFSYQDKNSNQVGFNIELLNLINKKLNTNITIKIYPVWSDALLDIISGDLGGVFSLSWTKERSKYIDYSPIYHYTTHEIIVKKSNNDIINFTDLSLKTIAGFKHHIISESIIENMPDAKLVYVETTEQAFKSISAGESDAAIFALPNIELLAKYQLKIVNSIFTKAGELSIGTTKKHPMIGKIITKGINAISQVELTALASKWQITRNKQSIFTQQEREYIVNNPTVVVGVEPWKPIIFATEQGDVSGILGDVLQTISDISGLIFMAKKENWIEQLDHFSQQKIDLLPATFYTKLREKTGLYGDGYFDLSYSIFIKPHDHHINSMVDLNGLRLAVIDGDALNSTIKQKFPQIKIVTALNTQHSLTKLLNDEVDAIFSIDIVMSELLINGLVQGVKSVRQVDIPSQSLHFYSQLNNPLLHSILNKSLYSISKAQLSSITEKWLGSHESKQSLKLALATGRDPYTLNSKRVKGIEFDIVSRIFAMDSTQITSAINLSSAKLEQALDSHPDVDVAVGVSAKKDRYYYSDDFISFNNVAVTRKRDALKIRSIDDLKGKSIIAFDKAYQYLGQQYAALFEPQFRPANYQEITFQQQQFKGLTTGDVDVLIIDKTVFNWFATKEGYSSLSQFEFHPIFSQSNQLTVGFRDKKLRDRFNENLLILKKTGEYQHIINGYDQGIIVQKIEVTSLISALSSKLIFDEDIDLLKQLIDLIDSLPYISRVEVYNNVAMIYGSAGTRTRFYKQANSYHLVSGGTAKVGFVKVFFDDQQVIKQLASSNLIPDIGFFKSQENYLDIWDLYQRLNYFGRSVEFTPKERNYLMTHPIVTYSEINWEPLIFFNDNEIEGLIADYMTIIENRTGIEFTYVAANYWTEVLTLFNNREIDIIPSVVGDSFLGLTGGVSVEYASFSLAIVMDNRGGYVESIFDLKDKTFAIPSGYTSFEYMATNYPDVLIIETKNEREALNLVQSGEADAFVGHLAVAAYRLENEFSDLKIVGLLDYDFSHRMLVQYDNPILLSIMNKVISSISPEQHQKIRHNWLQSKVTTAIDYRVLYNMMAVFFGILFGLFIVFKKLSHAKKQIEQTNIELELSIVELNQAHAQLVQSEKMASLGGLVAGISHEINTPVGIGLTAITHFIEITRQLEFKYQQQKMSQQDFDRYLKSSIQAAEIINRNLERTADLVRSFKQISVDQSSDERRSFNINQYIQEILLSIRHITKKSRVEIQVHCDPVLVIDSYPGAISQIISNLLINSNIHGYPNNESGLITIVVERENNDITINYQDDGQGVSSNNLSKIFEPFFTTNREHGGSGLGLNIIYNIVTNTLNGTIICNSAEGQGVEFIIKFKI